MAKTKPQTDQQTTLGSWSEVDSSLKAIAVIVSKIKKDEAQWNEERLKLQNKYTPVLDRYNAEKIGLERDIQLFCESQKDIFSESRSRALNYGTVGFRLGNGALKTLKGITWEAAKSLIKSSKKWREKFLRIKEDIDKNAIITAGLKKEELAKIGVYIHQEDSFYYEAFLTKSEEMPADRTGGDYGVF